MDRASATRQWIDRFVSWAKSRDDIRAVILVGSMGRKDHSPAVEWSDVDLLFTTTNLETYTENNSWMKEIDSFWSGVLPPEETFGDWLPVCCGFSTFEDGVDAEFFILSSKRIRRTLPLIRLLNHFPPLRRWLPETVASLGSDLGDILRNGAQVCLDKDGLARDLMDATLVVPVVPPEPPSQKKFQNNVDDFWIGPSRIVAHLRRGYLVAALKTLETTRRDLLKMVEWHARAKKAWRGDDLAYRPNRIETWADPRVKTILSRLYAGYDAEEIKQALYAMLELFSWLSMETADMLGYACVSESEQIIAWVKDCFSLHSK